MKNNIDFTDYTRITDVLLYLNDIISLNFTVVLSKNDKFGARKFFSFETEYNKDGLGNPMRSIKRTMSYYFVIDNREVFANGMIFRPQDVEYLNRIIELQILPWYFGDKKNNAFQIVDKTLVLKEFNPVTYTQSDSKYIIFEPKVIAFENGLYTQGIKLQLGSGDIIEMELDRFMGMVNVLKSDMYAVASSMINYVKIPPYGINEYKMVGLGSGKVKDNTQIPNYSGRGAASFLDNIGKKGN